MKKIGLIAVILLCTGCGKMLAVVYPDTYQILSREQDNKQMAKDMEAYRKDPVNFKIDYSKYNYVDNAYRLEKMFRGEDVPPYEPIPTRIRRTGGYSAGGSYGNSYIQTPNAYGPGIHMDQYGNAVRVTP